MRKIILAIVLVLPIISMAQNKVTVNNYEFRAVKDNDAFGVQDQHITGTCWSFSTLSFIESEVMRIKDMEVKLSEMWIVRHTYIEKAERYIRFHGNVNFDQGGAAHDVTAMIDKYGIVPESVYSGLQYGTDKHHHSELRNVLRAMCDEIIKNPNRTLSTAWRQAIIGVVDAYLGQPVANFEYNGKSFTPKEFAKYCGIVPDNYVVVTSFTHQPMHQPFILELPDNWMHLSAYNVSLTEMMATLDNSIDKGFTLAWGADVSEKGFAHRSGVAIWPKGNFENLSRDEIKELLKSPQEQAVVTAETRQKGYDNYQTTDDHGMHITGMYREKNGEKYYKVKNSWGMDSNDYDGYFFASDAYIMAKTINFMVHKDALPKSLKKSLGI
ncbi:MAG: aminopeptidase C [Bacteroidia bacterium]